MNIHDNLGLDTVDSEIVSFLGGGGKTTTLFLLAKELRRMNKKVLVTTTTAIFDPKGEYDYYFLKELDTFHPRSGSITIFGDRVKDEKLIGVSLEKIEDIIKKELFDYILIEADGAKRKPIKAPADYEPVVPKSTTMTIGVIGLDCFGESIGSVVHRPEIFIKITKTDFLDQVDEDIITKLVLNKKGLFKNAYGKKILLLNKACTEEDVLNGMRLKAFLLDNKFEGKVVITDIRNNKFF